MVMVMADNARCNVYVRCVKRIIANHRKAMPGEDAPLPEKKAACMELAYLVSLLRPETVSAFDRYCEARDLPCVLWRYPGPCDGIEAADEDFRRVFRDFVAASREYRCPYESMADGEEEEA
jgi:hypothetical protein